MPTKQVVLTPVEWDKIKNDNQRRDKDLWKIDKYEMYANMLCPVCEHPLKEHWETENGFREPNYELKCKKCESLCAQMYQWHYHKKSVPFYLYQSDIVKQKDDLIKRLNNKIEKLEEKIQKLIDAGI